MKTRRTEVDRIVRRDLKFHWVEYIELCGQALARAHARTGDAAQIAGYLGKNDTFDQAIAKSAVDCADQTDSDHAVFVKAIRTRRLPVRTDMGA